MGGNFYTFYDCYLNTRLLLFSYLSSTLRLLITLLYNIDLYLSGDTPSAHLTAPLTPFLTFASTITGYIAGIYTLGGETYSLTSTTSFYFKLLNRSSYLFRNTLLYCCKCLTKPSPGWIQGRCFFTFYLAQSYPKLYLLITQAITNELLLDTPAQQCTNTPPFLRLSSINVTTSSSNSTDSFCCLLSWISQNLWVIYSDIFYLGGRAQMPIETIVLILFGLRTVKSKAELQSPSTRGPSDAFSLRIRFAEKYLFIFEFIQIYLSLFWQIKIVNNRFMCKKQASRLAANYSSYLINRIIRLWGNTQDIICVFEVISSFEQSYLKLQQFGNE